jgi:hypothetical protein
MAASFILKAPFESRPRSEENGGQHQDRKGHGSGEGRITARRHHHNPVREHASQMEGNPVSTLPAKRTDEASGFPVFDCARKIALKIPIGRLMSSAIPQIARVPTMAFPKPPLCSSGAGGS